MKKKIDIVFININLQPNAVVVKILTRLYFQDPSGLKKHFKITWKINYITLQHGNKPVSNQSAVF